MITSSYEYVFALTNKNVLTKKKKPYLQIFIDEQGTLVFFETEILYNPYLEKGNVQKGDKTELETIKKQLDVLYMSW